MKGKEKVQAPIVPVKKLVLHFDIENTIVIKHTERALSQLDMVRLADY